MEVEMCSAEASVKTMAKRYMSRDSSSMAQINDFRVHMIEYTKVLRGLMKRMVRAVRTVRRTRVIRKIRTRRKLLILSMPLPPSDPNFSSIEIAVSTNEQTTINVSNQFHGHRVPVKKYRRSTTRRHTSSAKKNTVKTSSHPKKKSGLGTPGWCATYSTSAPMRMEFTKMAMDMPSSNLALYTILESRERCRSSTMENILSDTCC
mmetsp:Transcript_55845/g.120755  ORF Transcript_55845/g.120755 Transcript_55845/m.120755 type:complete len:205 (+) Transcript_55845:636-1250(+)